MSDDACYCAACDRHFEDSLAWAAHKPWISRWGRGKCGVGRHLYESKGVFKLRPKYAPAIAKAEYGPADDWKVTA